MPLAPHNEQLTRDELFALIDGKPVRSFTPTVVSRKLRTITLPLAQRELFFKYVDKGNQHNAPFIDRVKFT